MKSQMAYCYLAVIYRYYTPVCNKWQVLAALFLATIAYALLCGMWLGFLLFVWTDTKEAPGRIE
jgi:hypothetical protein